MNTANIIELVCDLCVNLKCIPKLELLQLDYCNNIDYIPILPELTVLKIKYMNTIFISDLPKLDELYIYLV